MPSTPRPGGPQIDPITYTSKDTMGLEAQVAAKVARAKAGGAVRKGDAPAGSVGAGPFKVPVPTPRKLTRRKNRGPL